MFGQTIKVKQTSINENDCISSISELVIDFDFSEAASSLGMDESELGLSSGMSDFNTMRMLIYKGEKSSSYIGVEQDPTESENIVGSGYRAISKKNVVAGNHSITIPLTAPIDLERGVIYTIYIPHGLFRAGIPGTTYKETLLNDPILIQIVGGDSQEETLKVEESFPSSGEYIDNVQQIDITFNQNVEVVSTGVATISTNGEHYAVSSSIEANDNIVSIKFESVILYNGKDYMVEIPQGIISSQDGSISNDPITLIYKGSGYHYIETGRISPNPSKSISWLSNISIPFTFPEGYNIGKVEGDLVKIYEGDLDGEYITAPCSSDGNTTLVVQPMKFDLKPNTTYYVVLDEAQIFPARTDDYRIKLKDTTNPRVELAYTTPEVLESPVKVSLSNSVPAHLDACERLDDVTLNLEPYEFEDNAYDIWLANEDAKAIFSDGTTETNVPLTFNNGETSAKVSINRPLEAGKEYTLRIPANTFKPNAHENLAAVAGNDEMLLTVTGKAAVADMVSLNVIVDGTLTIKMNVEKGKAQSVALTAPEGRDIENVTLNGDNLTGDNGVYAIPALEEDGNLVVNVSPEEIPAPEFISIALNIDEYASATYRMVKGQESVLDLKAGNDWKIDTLTLNGDDVTSEVDENGLYTLPALNEDAKLDAIYAYAHEINYDYETGVGNIENLPYAVSKDGGHVIISGLNGGENIAIYTVGGMKVAELPEVPADMAKASIALPEDQVYIILINGTSIKFKH